MNELNEIHWAILDWLLNDEEPFEVVDSVVKEKNPNNNTEETLNILFDLFKLGMIKIRQCPIGTFGQSFEEKGIIPSKPTDIIGDLEDFYKEYSKKREYLWTIDLGNTGHSSGIPFGIWISITDVGREEWGREIYKKYQNKDD